MDGDGSSKLVEYCATSGGDPGRAGGVVAASAHPERRRSFSDPDPAPATETARDSSEVPAFVVVANALGDLWRLLADAGARATFLPPKVYVAPDALALRRQGLAQSVEGLLQSLAHDLTPPHLLGVTAYFAALAGGSPSRAFVLETVGRTFLRENGACATQRGELYTNLLTSFWREAPPACAGGDGPVALWQGVQEDACRLTHESVRLATEATPTLLLGSEDRQVFDSTIRAMIGLVRGTLAESLPENVADSSASRAVGELMDTCLHYAARAMQGPNAKRLAGAVLTDLGVQLAPLSCEAHILPQTPAAAAVREVGRVLSGLGVDVLYGGLGQQIARDVKHFHHLEQPILIAFRAAADVVFRGLYTANAAYVPVGDQRIGPLLPGREEGLFSSVPTQQQRGATSVYVHAPPPFRH